MSRYFFIPRAVKRFITDLALRVARDSGRYTEDGLVTVHNHEFLDDPEFQAAYARGLQSGHGVDPCHRWRVHTALWVAHAASKLDGDFVECGVNTGFISSAVMKSLNWNQLNKTFYLFDTFDGPVEDWFSETERAQAKVEQSIEARALGRYFTNVAAVQHNFSEWNGVRVVKGAIPQTLDQANCDHVAYLHIDMNQAYPEAKAAEYFWPRLVDGAFVLLDDYAYKGYEAQKIAMDKFARRVGVSILSMPTGQGLMVRPPHRAQE